jgi:glutaredoxin
VKAQRWLDARGYRYEFIDVEADRTAMEEMVRRSGQHRCPTLVVGDRVLPDFGPEELAGFLGGGPARR